MFFLEYPGVCFESGEKNSVQTTVFLKKIKLLRRNVVFVLFSSHNARHKDRKILKFEQEKDQMNNQRCEDRNMENQIRFKLGSANF